MPQRTYTLWPRDPMLARDGRPFTTDPGALAESLPWPLPSTLAGALRAHVGGWRGYREWSPDQVEAIKHVAVAGPLMAASTEGADWRIYVSAPCDAVLFGKPEALEVMRLRPMAQLPDGAGCDLADGLLPLAVDREEKPAKGHDYWSLDDIESLRPEKVVFLCSADTTHNPGSYPQVTGAGLVCGPPGKPPERLNIPAQLGLSPDAWELAPCVDPDDLSDCYAAVVEVLRGVRARDAGARLYCDYTGGTKTMAVALALAAVDDGDVRLMLTTGRRADLVTVVDGVQCLTPARVEEVVLRRLRREVEGMLARYAYDAAAGTLRDHLAARDLGHRAHAWLQGCCAFDAWDCFAHAEALRLLRGTGDTFAAHRAFLGRVAHGGASPAWQHRQAGYLLAGDLLANAARRAAQGRGDDAIGRHYRAVELIVQTLLWDRHQIDTGKCPAATLCQWLPDLPADGEKALGLLRAWELAGVACPAVTPLWADWEQRLRAAITRRNEALFAHGTRPITREDYLADVAAGMAAFARAALETLAAVGLAPAACFPPEWPTTLPDDAPLPTAQAPA